MNRTSIPDRSTQSSRDWTYLVCLSAGQAVLYAAVAWFSLSFVYGEGFQRRPILPVLGLLGCCFGLYVLSLFVAVRIREESRLVGVILGSAVGFRMLMLFSQPIQEIDIYRYLWDGAVAFQGVSPYRFSPAEVLAADRLNRLNTDDESDVLLQLVRLRDKSPGLAEALRRIHYPELTTVYPPVSQTVFAAASALTPNSAALATRVTIMKSVLLTFDLATVALVLWLLRATGTHLGWAIGYAWCPLVIKEFANSGHLDTIAVCLTTASLCCTARLYQGTRKRSLPWVVSAVLLGLSVGAKLYAIVLWPLLMLITVRRAGFRQGTLFGVIAVLTSGASLAPMFRPQPTHAVSTADVDAVPKLPHDSGLNSTAVEPQPRIVWARSGLVAFLSRWEMNDFLFLIVVENLRPVESRPNQPQPWFAVVPNGWRGSMVLPWVRRFSGDVDRAVFSLARGATASLFLGIVLTLLVMVLRDDRLPRFLEASFLTLAWFWLLSPTQNPWYWTWALPLIPFARNRAWLAVSGLVLVYYVRFWLTYHWPGPGILGTCYDGRLFFDFVVTWVEFGPWLAWLTLPALLHWVKKVRSSRSPRRWCVIDFTDRPPPGPYSV